MDLPQLTIKTPEQCHQFSFILATNPANHCSFKVNKNNRNLSDVPKAILKTSDRRLSSVLSVTFKRATTFHGSFSFLCVSRWLCGCFTSNTGNLISSIRSAGKGRTDTICIFWENRLSWEKGVSISIYLFMMEVFII